MSARIQLDNEKIAEFCRKQVIVEFSLFGSVLRDDFGPQSDVDVLVKFDPSAKLSLFDLVRMQDELGELLGRKVDHVEREAVGQSEN